jgi:hypothetical protein
VTVVGIIGERRAVDAYLSGPHGADAARALARRVFEDDDRLAAFELGEAELPAAVEAELDRLITQRNRRERA